MAIYLVLGAGALISFVMAMIGQPFLVLVTIAFVLGLILFWSYDQVNMDFKYDILSISQDSVGAMLDATRAMDLSKDNSRLIEEVMSLERQVQTSHQQALADFILLSAEDKYPGSLERHFGEGFKDEWEQERKTDEHIEESKLESLYRQGRERSLGCS